MRKMVSILMSGFFIMTMNAPTFGQAQSLKIILDYRFDGGYFSEHPERKVPLEYAASLWEKVLKTPRFIPAGTAVTLRYNQTSTKTTKVTFDKKVDGFVVFVYAHDYAKEVDDKGVPAPSNSKAAGYNFGKNLAIGYTTINTNGGRPWFFDQTPETADDVPLSDHYDIITTMVHEFGHILGFGQGNMTSYTKSFGKEDLRFCGPAAIKANGGQPVPLAKDGTHLRGDWWNDKYLGVPPIDRHSMHTGDPVQGYRALMTAIDVAIMEDIGWKVDYGAVPADPYYIKDDYRKAAMDKYFGINKKSVNPVGLWVFDNQESAGSAIIGYPLRYSPPKGKVGGMAGLFKEKEIQVPTGGWLYCVPKLKTSGKNGKECNRYTLVFDVRLPQGNTMYCLYNTNPFSQNDGECFINKEGLFGLGSAYSTSKIEAGRWYRLGIVIDADSKSRRYYIDGALSHEAKDVEMDGRFAMYPDKAHAPLFCFFGDEDGEDGTIDVRKLAVYDIPLNDQQMQKLGNSDSSIFGL